MENAPQPPEQSLLAEAQQCETFDAWLSTVQDDRLQQMINVVDQIDHEHIES